jgi:hypothetical protein
MTMLQVDGTLFMWSMSYSSSADSAENDKLTDEHESFLNHEVFLTLIAVVKISLNVYLIKLKG